MATSGAGREVGGIFLRPKQERDGGGIIMTGEAQTWPFAV